MKKNLGVKPYTFPMPVLMIATYGENDKVDVMNMAWGGVCASNMVALNIDEETITPEANLKDDLGIDSLAAVELALELETEFDIRIEDDELAKLETVQDIINIIEEKQK